MKKILLLLCLCPIYLFAQTTDDGVAELGPYFWRVKVLMEECDIDGNLNGNKVPSEPNQLFDIVAIVEDKAIISIIGYDSQPLKMNLYTFYEENTSKEHSVINTQEKSIVSAQEKISTDEKQSKIDSLNALMAKMEGFLPREKPSKTTSQTLPETPQKYFSVPMNLVRKYAIKNTYIPMTFEFGLLNFPFKYRFSKTHSNFGSSFNFGAALGFKFRKKSYKPISYSFITGYSVSSTSLEATEVRRNESDLETTNNFTSISFSAGPMIENNRVQIGLFVGLDFLGRLNQNHYGWVHQGKPWFSVGFGYTIFSKQEEKPSSSTNP